MHRDKSIAIAPGTETQYSARAESLLARYREEAGQEWYHDIKEFEWWFQDLADELSPSSVRQYRSALKCCLRGRGAHELLRRIQAIRGACAKKDRGTTAQRPRSIPSDCLMNLIEACKSRGAKWGPMAALWLDAGRLTGLRPVEWWNATLEYPWLTVVNAKSNETSDGTRERAFGRQRHLWLGNMSDDTVQVIKDFLAWVTAHDYTTAKAGVDQVIRRARKNLWPKDQFAYTLYSARHQFAADCKSAGFSWDEIAALMGHLSHETARTHYGHLRAGGGGTKTDFRVRPADSDVDLVAELNAHRATANASDTPSPGM